MTRHENAGGHSERTPRKRVVVTGMGAVSPLGSRMNDSWNGIMEGMVVAAPVRRFDASGFPTRIAYEVRDFAFDEGLVSREESSFLNEAAHYGLMAAREALEEAGLAGASVDRERLAVCLGVGMVSPGYDWYADVFHRGRFDDPSVRRHIRFFPDQLSSVAARLMGAQGGITTIHTACASSGQSLGEAYEQVAHGEADVVLTGGADCMIHPYYLAGFSLLGALSKRNDDPRTASRPFDGGREGFVLGEGAAMLVFEELEHARRRGARILGEIVGYGVTESAYRITDLHPEGIGPIEAMQMALDDAGVQPGEVGYINAHGTSTPLNDRIESLAISKVFAGCRPRVSSTKSMTGHMISAAGAIELAICVKALEKQVLPPSLNVFEQDPECVVELTRATPEGAELRYALSNSVGFGGSNTAIVARRFEG